MMAACQLRVDTGCVYVADGCHACAGHKGEMVGGTLRRMSPNTPMRVLRIHRSAAKFICRSVRCRTSGYLSINVRLARARHTMRRAPSHRKRGYHIILLEAHV